MEKLNISQMELVQKKKDEISKLKKAKFSVNNNQVKLVAKLAKREIVTGRKIATDLEEIHQIISQINEGETWKIISNVFDSPSFLKYFDPKTIKSLHISTWAITEQGIFMLKKLSDHGVKIRVLLDTTHSYKWVFKSGAFSLLSSNVEFKFTENHTKLQLFEFTNGTYITIAGSMNLSNNPRWENFEITKDKDTYIFYKTWLDSVMDGKTNTQKKLFE